MNIDTKRIVLLAKKYSLLSIIILLSIAIGGLAYSVSIDVTNENNNSLSNGLAITENGLRKVMLEDIITKNKVVLEKLEIQKEVVPYKTIELGRSKEGTITTLTVGRDGEKEITYKVRYEDDIETSRKEVSNEIIKEPVNKVIEYSGVAPSRSGETTHRENNSVNSSEGLIAPVSGYSKVIDVKFTSYCLCKKCTGKSPGDKGYGVTASGYKITPGKNEKVIAVDPKVIPLGSKVYIQGLNGFSDYGYAVAADTGGAIKGNKIDLYVDEHGSTEWWTVGNAKVYIME